MKDRDNLVVHSIYDLKGGVSVGYPLVDAFLGGQSAIEGAQSKRIFVSIGEPASSKTLFNGNALEEAFEECGFDRKKFFPIFLSWERYITAAEEELSKPKSKFKSGDWDKTSDRVTQEYRHIREVMDKLEAGDSPRKPKRLVVAGDLSGVAKENKGTSTIQELANWDDTFFLIFLPNPVNQMRARAIRREIQALQKKVNGYINRGEEVPASILGRAREIWVSNHVIPDLSTDEEILDHTKIMGSPGVMNKFNREIKEKTEQLEKQGLINPEEADLPDYIFEDIYRSFADGEVAERWIHHVQRRKAFLDYLVANVWQIPEQNRMMVFSRHVAHIAGVDTDIVWRQRILDASALVNF